MPTATKHTAQHTPGPWNLRGSYGESLYSHRNDDFVVTEDDSTIASVHHWTASGDEGHANACLIAAAPDLLAALEACREFWDNGTPVAANSLVAREAIHAIHKATGGCPAAMGCPA